jgi:UDP-N-acetylmuramoyl-L-alanyl-D-glutamate--2,6-diaminopimelate ligase
VMNAIAAATTAAAIGIGMEAIVAGLSAADAVPGRFERVTFDAATPLAIDVIVDYAHTPDGLEEVIAAAGALVGDRGRVIVAFGAGGDRDRPKRPEMGATAARLADLVVVTSDNPRSEDPADIIEDIVAGIPDDDRSRVEIEVDRAAAIRLAITLAEPGDIVIVAGKGHETTQTIGDQVVPFDDREVARAVLAEVCALPQDPVGLESGR